MAATRRRPLRRPRRLDASVRPSTAHDGSDLVAGPCRPVAGSQLRSPTAWAISRQRTRPRVTGVEPRGVPTDAHGRWGVAVGDDENLILVRRYTWRATGAAPRRCGAWTGTGTRDRPASTGWSGPHDRTATRGTARLTAPRRSGRLGHTAQLADGRRRPDRRGHVALGYRTMRRRDRAPDAGTAASRRRSSTSSEVRRRRRHVRLRRGRGRRHRGERATGRLHAWSPGRGLRPQLQQKDGRGDRRRGRDRRRRRTS